MTFRTLIPLFKNRPALLGLTVWLFATLGYFVLTGGGFELMTQTLVGMGKAAFTVVTGNPFIHFFTLHVVSARIPFDTGMYVDIFKVK